MVGVVIGVGVEWGGGFCMFIEAASLWM